MYNLLHNRSFCSLLMASILSVLGTQISRYGIVLYIAHEKDSVIDIAVFLIIELLPGVLITPLSCAVIDRFNKKLLMILSDISRTIFVVVIIVYPTIAVIYCMAALLSIGTAFFRPARHAITPFVVQKNDLIKANSIEQSLTNCVMIIGPIIGAALYSQIGLTTTLAIDAASFMMSAVFISFITVYDSTSARSKFRDSSVNNMVQGWHYLTHHRLAFHLVSLAFISLVCYALGYGCHWHRFLFLTFLVQRKSHWGYKVGYLE